MQTAIGKNIRKYRRANDLTIEQLAKAIGSQAAYVWKLENRTPKNPSRLKLEAIAETLKISVEKLYSKNDVADKPNGDDAYWQKFLGIDEDSKAIVKQIIDRIA